jgi:AcrR family transcriptional regulator
MLVDRQAALRHRSPATTLEDIVSADSQKPTAFSAPFPEFAVREETAGDRHPTRQALLAAAIQAFSLSGFDGVTIRDVERRAGVNRGLVAHHFGSKAALWEAAFDSMMRDMAEELARYWDFLALVSWSERARILLRIYVHFVARHPEFFRLILIEGREPSARSEILAERYMRPLEEMFKAATGAAEDAAQRAIRHFILFGAASAIFGVPAYAKMLFGIDPRDPEFVEKFADAISDVWAGVASIPEAAPEGAGDEPADGPGGDRRAA